MSGTRDRDKNDGLDSLRDAVWDSHRDAVTGGYDKDDAARDTDSSRGDVDRAWSDAAADSEN